MVRSFLSSTGGALILTGAITLVSALVLSFVVIPIIRVIARRSGSEHAERMIGLVRVPLTLGIVLAGGYIAFEQLSYSERLRIAVAKWASALATLIVVYLVLRIVRVVTEHYRARAEAAGYRNLGYFDLARKVTQIALLIVGLLVILGQLGVEITPLVASLGLAGLAVGLALQDTLGNLFAGFYILFDRPIRRGDYIKLESGEEGFITEIGWRNTKIRPWANTIVVIPNAKLAESVITNYHLPIPELSVYVWCGVSYDSNLEQVERVTLEVARDIRTRFDETVQEWDPVVRFKEFGDSNITFLTVLRVKEPTAQYLIAHEFIKALHGRFRQEGIEINYPVRRIVWPEGVAAGLQTRTESDDTSDVAGALRCG